VLSLIGAFFLISDYIITAALSAISAFHYLGVPHEQAWAIIAIAVIGILNLLGPKHTGSLSLWLGIPTIIVVIILSVFSAYFIPQAVEKLEPVSSHFKENWLTFVGIIVALSGIESIANTTGSMKLDPGTSEANASVSKTSTPAILAVMLEVSIFTCFLGLVMNALPGLEIHNGEVSAPGYPNVRDAMLRYMAEVFGGTLLGSAFGYYFSLIVSVVFALLLLSAVNTAMIALISLFFVMTRDGELPDFFQKLNRFGVPHYSTLVALLIPIFVLLVIHDVASLANLYAIGFVGAIAINLGATSTNFKLDLKSWERFLMFFTCLVMTLIEITLFIEKPHARGFVITVIGIGLLLRAIVSEQKEQVVTENRVKQPPVAPPAEPEEPLAKESILVAVTGINRSLDFALEEAETRNKPLYILFIREQKIVTEKDSERLWVDDDGACKVVDYVTEKCCPAPLRFLYTITPHTTYSIIEIAKQKQVHHIILGRKRGAASTLLNSLRGTTIREVSRQLPKNIDLVVIY
jgi:amino acid transporter